MKHFIILIILLLGIYTTCSKDAETDTISVKKLQKNDTWNTSLFFSWGHYLYGINPVSDTISTRLQFDRFVIYGGYNKGNNTIVMADNGKRIGDWGKHIYLLDESVKVKSVQDIFPNPAAVKIEGNLLFVSTKSFTKKGLTGLKVFNKDTLEVVYESREIGEIVNNSDIRANDTHAYISIQPLNAQNIKRAGHILQMDVKTGSVKKLTYMTEDSPYEPFKILVSGNNLYIVFLYTFELARYDLRTGKKMKSIKLDDFVSIPPSYFNESIRPVAGYPVMINGSICILIADTGDDTSIQNLVFVKPDTLQVNKVVQLDKTRDFSFSKIKYVKNNKLYFTGHRNVIVTGSDGKILKTIILK